MLKCQECDQEYDPKEVERTCGGWPWRHKFCSPQCYTTDLVKKQQVKSTIKFTGGEITWGEFGRQLVIGALERFKIAEGDQAKELLRGLASVLASCPSDLEGVVTDAGIKLDTSDIKIL